MNITLSIPDDLVESARQISAARGISLNQLIRDYLDDLAGRGARGAALEALEALWREGPHGDSAGRKFDRESVYAERLDRYPSR